MINPQPNFDAAISFLQRWMPGGPWVLTAIIPQGKGIQTLALTKPGRLRDTLVCWSDRRWGIYFHVNPDRRDPAAIRSKAAKADIAEARWLHCDLDLYKDGRGRGEVLEAVQHVKPGPPAVITSSGHGIQAFWRLQQPVVLAGSDDIERVEARNRWLARELGGDSTFDVSRIMRLPGCVNWPNQRKQAMGLGPALATLISWDDTLAYDLEAVPALAGSRARAADLDFDIETSDLTALPPRLIEIIEHGRVEGEQLDGDDSGSGWAFHLALGLLRRGWPVGRVAGALLESAWLAGKDESVDIERQAKRTAARAMRVVADWREAERQQLLDATQAEVDEAMGTIEATQDEVRDLL